MTVVPSKLVTRGGVERQLRWLARFVRAALCSLRYRDSCLVNRASTDLATSRARAGDSGQAELYPGCLVEDRGLEPRSSPCKGDVLPNELIPREFGRPGVIRTLDLTRIRRALFLLSYWSLVAAPGVDSLRSPCGRTACVCRRYAPRLNRESPVSETGRYAMFPSDGQSLDRTRSRKNGAGAYARSGVCKHCRLKTLPRHSHNPHC